MNKPYNVPLRTIFINTESGSDQNDGSQEQPLRSYEEYDRRKKSGAYPYRHAVSFTGAISVKGFQRTPNRKERRKAAKTKARK